MHYSNISIVDLKTMEACDKAIALIENDHRNILGGLCAWNSGYSTDLLSGATKKIEAIQRKHDRLFNKWIKDQYKIYVKENGNVISFEEYEEKEMYC